MRPLECPEQPPHRGHDHSHADGAGDQPCVQGAARCLRPGDIESRQQVWVLRDSPPPHDARHGGRTGDAGEGEAPSQDQRQRRRAGALETTTKATARPLRPSNRARASALTTTSPTIDNAPVARPLEIERRRNQVTSASSPLRAASPHR